MPNIAFEGPTALVGPEHLSLWITVAVVCLFAIVTLVMAIRQRGKR